MIQQDATRATLPDGTPVIVAEPRPALNATAGVPWSAVDASDPLWDLAVVISAGRNGYGFSFVRCALPFEALSPISRSTKFRHWAAWAIRDGHVPGPPDGQVANGGLDAETILRCIELHCQLPPGSVQVDLNQPAGVVRLYAAPHGSGVVETAVVRYG